MITSGNKYVINNGTGRLNNDKNINRTEIRLQFDTKHCQDYEKKKTNKKMRRTWLTSSGLFLGSK